MQPCSCHLPSPAPSQVLWGAETALVPKTLAQTVPKGAHHVTPFAVHPPPTPPGLAQAEHVLTLPLNGWRVSSTLHSKPHTHPCSPRARGSARKVVVVLLRASTLLMAGNHSPLVPWGAPQQHQHQMQLLILSTMAAEPWGQQAAGFPCTAPCIQAGRGFSTFLPQPDTSWPLPPTAPASPCPLCTSLSNTGRELSAWMSCQSSCSPPQGGQPQPGTTQQVLAVPQKDQESRFPTAG